MKNLKRLICHRRGHRFISHHGLRICARCGAPDDRLRRALEDRMEREAKA